MPASTEFAALCQSQIALMAEVTGADSTAVYLAESWSEQAVPNLIPIATYPSMAGAAASTASPTRALPGRAIPPSDRLSAPAETDLPHRSSSGTDPFLSVPSRSGNWSQTAERLAIPLIHEGGVLGVLVGWRGDRPWQEQDRQRMEEFARSLTLACVLDQRGQWLKNQMSSLDRVQTQQSDRFHELLHQLRSPLTALKTFGKLLAKRLPTEDQNQTLVVNMLRESDRMQELLGYFDDTLQAADESREETATTVPLLAPAKEDAAIVVAEAQPTNSDSLSHFGGTLQLQPCAIAPLIAPLIELTAALADAAAMSLSVFPPIEEVWVQADSKALIEILSNFIDNSLKYSLPGAHIWLQWGLVHPQHSHLSGILVGDTGPGIPQIDQAQIFERHFRGVQATGPLEGSGLGLAIAADLVQEMQGHIELHSPLRALPFPIPKKIQADGEFVGAAFITWLPRAEAKSPE